MASRPNALSELFSSIEVAAATLPSLRHPARSPRKRAANSSSGCCVSSGAHMCGLSTGMQERWEHPASRWNRRAHRPSSNGIRAIYLRQKAARATVPLACNIPASSRSGSLWRWTCGVIAADNGRTSRLLRHAAHSPSIPGALPQGHLRCRTDVCVDVRDGARLVLSRIGLRRVVVIAKRYFAFVVGRSPNNRSTTAERIGPALSMISAE